ncbi:mechanosensitive ion channel domain-containing protein [Rubrivivax gelatinosus]|uniref:mechanosensitive ion channel domain-containing protein n=1 Tax=Rubrivivax gelatinosus TaxID=28068 RepID=UPI0019030856
MVQITACRAVPPPGTRSGAWRGGAARLLAATVLAFAGSLAGAADGTDAGAATLELNHRRIADLRATLLGDAAAERAAMARAALEEAARHGPGVVTHTRVGDSVRFDVDGMPMFFLAADDLPGRNPEAMLDAAALKTERRLVQALQEAHEAADPRRLAAGAGWAAGATVAVLLALRALLALRRLASARLGRRVDAWQARAARDGVLATYLPHTRSAAALAGAALAWGAALLLVDLWAGFVLRQFAYTRPWGERATGWLLTVLGDFALGAAGAVPGLLIVALIFVLARLATRALSLLLRRVEQGELGLAWLDRDTAVPTRRIGNLLVWLFALALAYPYLPGASSESFKGVTVLAGLMLSLGASGVVGQAMAGVGLMYSRSLRVGEYVRIGEVEGTVTAIGMFATKLHTGLGEEVSLPNTVVVGQPVRNFSRLVQDGQFVLHTGVTIGYATPWRQVHAMLLEAARRTPGVAAEPAPYVVQTALSDFYVEYRLVAQADRGAPRSRAEAMNRLLANIQDVFNENGVQIMSPHYRGDPPAPQVVAPGEWFAGGPPLKPPPA